MPDLSRAGRAAGVLHQLRVPAAEPCPDAGAHSAAGSRSCVVHPLWSRRGGKPILHDVWERPLGPGCHQRVCRFGPSNGTRDGGAGGRALRVPGGELGPRRGCRAVACNSCNVMAAVAATASLASGVGGGRCGRRTAPRGRRGGRRYGPHRRRRQLVWSDVGRQGGRRGLLGRRGWRWVLDHHADAVRVSCTDAGRVPVLGRPARFQPGCLRDAVRRRGVEDTAGRAELGVPGPRSEARSGQRNLLRHEPWGPAHPPPVLVLTRW